MNCTIDRLTAMAAACALMLGLASTASAQVFTGRVDVTVEDATGGRLPGVNVDLTGPVNLSQVTDAQGLAHFLNLTVGTYAVKANLSGFNPYNNNQVQVAVGAATAIPIKLAVAGTTETVNVTAATPQIDTKRQTTTTNVTLEELQNIPSARDPWVVMQTVPTIYVDRVNVGGSESGQQSNYIAKGAQTSDNTWNLDGVPITDMGATGATPTYYNFDMFNEMAVTTGGADASNATPGAQLNMVLKKGSNTVHGNASGYFENQSLQSNNLPPALAAIASIGGTGGKGNRTDKYSDYGFDIGGPILKDRIWAWGSIGRTDVRNLTLTSTVDETFLRNYAFKADAQATNNTRFNFTFFEGNKIKNGRGASPTHPAETTWNQTGPTKMYKGEGNFVVGQNLFIAARGAYITGGFELAPVGGLNTQMYLDDSGVWHGSYYYFKTDRPQYYGGADGSYFAGKQEIKFGFSYRKTPVDSISQATGNRIISEWNGYPDMQALVYGDTPLNTTGRYVSVYGTDTISLNRLTIVAGLRFDHQTSSYDATTRPAVPGFENVLPTLNAPALPNVFDWNSVTPRIGMTYSVDDSRKTIARASYAMFASQLPANRAAVLSPIQNTYVYYNATEHGTNGAPCVTVGSNGCTGIAKLGDIDFSQIASVRGFDPAHPTSLSSVNLVDPNEKSPITHEFLIGMDHQVMPNFAVSGTISYRRFNNLTWDPRIGLLEGNFVQTGTVTGTFAEVGSVNVPYFAPTTSPPGGGRIYENRQGYHQQYLGFELSATKRMSNRWMGRFGFSTNTYKEYFDTPATAIEDPTVAPSSRTAQPTAGPNVNGGVVTSLSSGSGKSSLYLVAPKYQFIANGLYDGPWGINFGGNLVARQGYGQPFYFLVRTAHDPNIAQKQVLLTSDVDSNRLPMVASLDVRVEKAFKFQKMSFALDFDVFNVGNAGTTLGKQYDASKKGLTGYDQTLEIMNPRIARVGVRFFF